MRHLKPRKDHRFPLDNPHISGQILLFLICVIYLMLPSGSSKNYMTEDTFPGLDLYYTDLAQLLVTAGYYLDDLHHDLPNVRNSSTAVKYKKSHFNIRYDTLSPSTARRFASKIPKRDDSVADDVLLCGTPAW